MKTTETHGNAKNGIKGTKLSIWNWRGKLVDSFVVPVRFGAKKYCTDHPTGKYGKRYSKAVGK